MFNAPVWWNGRHKGLKIPRPKNRTGSIPVGGTRKADTRLGCLLFVIAEDSNPSNGTVRWTVPRRLDDADTIV